MRVLVRTEARFNDRTPVYQVEEVFIKIDFSRTQSREEPLEDCAQSGKWQAVEVEFSSTRARSDLKQDSGVETRLLRGDDGMAGAGQSPNVSIVGECRS